MLTCYLEKNASRIDVLLGKNNWFICYLSNECISYVNVLLGINILKVYMLLTG